MSGSPAHEPVLAEEALDFLKAREGGLFVDCTLGPGGHAEELLKSSPSARVIGIDRDEDAVAAAAERLKGFGERLACIRENYSSIDMVLGEMGIPSADGILLDLGISSAQLADGGRGFSFMKEGPLDMRMDRSMELKARDIVNGYTRKKLEFIFRELGGEHRAGRIAAAIDEQRRRAPIETTSRLAEIAAGACGRRGRLHPATKIFQALRIAVNGELEALESFLGKALPLLAAGGRLCVISYHSLEDRIVKNRFREFKIAGAAAILTKKPVFPSRAEVLRNKRSRSARLRALEKL